MLLLLFGTLNCVLVRYIFGNCAVLYGVCFCIMVKKHDNYAWVFEGMLLDYTSSTKNGLKKGPNIQL